jgi:DegV family protein with EDD domain
VERYNVTILPLYITMGDKTGKDGVEITPDEIFKWADETGDTPKTSAITPDDAIKAIQDCKENEEEGIFIGISEDMSCTCNVLRIEAEELEYSDKFHVINSMNLSTGIGHLVVEAAIMAQEGKQAEDVREIEMLREKVRASFVIETLTYFTEEEVFCIDSSFANTLRLNQDYC